MNLTYYCIDDNIDIQNTYDQAYLTRNTSISFKKVYNIDHADFIFLGDFLMFWFKYYIPPESTLRIGEFKSRLLKTFPLLNEIDFTNKRLLISLNHERVNLNHFVKFLKFLQDEFGITKSQIWLVDLNFGSYPFTNHVPLEIKIRQFSNFKYENYDDHHFRHKKITCLNNKGNVQRLMVIDRFLNVYQDQKTMMDENVISFLTCDKINFADKSTRSSFEHMFKNDFSMYEDNHINFPWTLDVTSIEPPFAHADKILPSILEHYKKSIITVSSETEQVFFLETDFFKDDNFNLPNDMQFSEKSILPIVGGSFLFSITDGMFYRNMENIGFDFSYLKELFDIDYTTNTALENIEEVTKIVNFVKNKSIQDLNSFRANNYHYIEHNRKLMLDILFGDYSDAGVKFWEKLSGKKLR